MPSGYPPIIFTSLFKPVAAFAIEIIPFAQYFNSTSLKGLNLPLISFAAPVFPSASTINLANSLLLIDWSSFNEPSSYPLIKPLSLSVSIFSSPFKPPLKSGAAIAPVTVISTIAIATIREHTLLNINLPPYLI